MNGSSLSRVDRRARQLTPSFSILRPLADSQLINPNSAGIPHQFVGANPVFETVADGHDAQVRGLVAFGYAFQALLDLLRIAIYAVLGILLHELVGDDCGSSTRLDVGAENRGENCLRAPSNGAWPGPHPRPDARPFIQCGGQQLC